MRKQILTVPYEEITKHIDSGYINGVRLKNLYNQAWSLKYCKELAELYLCQLQNHDEQQKLPPYYRHTIFSAGFDHVMSKDIEIHPMNRLTIQLDPISSYAYKNISTNSYKTAVFGRSSLSTSVYATAAIVETTRPEITVENFTVHPKTFQTNETYFQIVPFNYAVCASYKDLEPFKPIEQIKSKIEIKAENGINFLDVPVKNPDVCQENSCPVIMKEDRFIFIQKSITIKPREIYKFSTNYKMITPDIFKYLAYVSKETINKQLPPVEMYSLAILPVNSELREHLVGGTKPKSTENQLDPNLKVRYGLIDSDYEGEIKILVQNITDNPIIIEKNTAICEIVKMFHLFSRFDTDLMMRDGGFGSTNKF